jgi:hypothetical protein
MAHHWFDPDLVDDARRVVLAPAWALAGLLVCVAVMAGILGWAAHAAFGG